MMAGNEGTLPLRGVRVVELAQNLAGPYCGQILADLGAAVVKVERPGDGDAARAWGPPFVAGAGSIFSAANRGKRSISLDITEAAGRSAVRRLVERSDVLIESFRPGAFARMGYDADTVAEWNPQLIYCSVLAYGETGPLATLPGYDPLMQAHGGIMAVTGHPEGGPARVGTSIIDMGTGMWLTIGVLAALRQRDATGVGTRLSVALYDTALAWNAYHLAGYLDTGFVPGPMGTGLPMIAPYGAFPTLDGQIMLAPANDGLFTRLCTALGVADAAADPRFRDNPSRVANRAAVDRLIGGATAHVATAALLARLRDAGVPCAPIQGIAEVAADPQTAASDMVVAAADGTAVALPLRVNGERPPMSGVVPRAGEHTAEVLAELAGGDGAFSA
jgi:crotonobetainyl-CoA:carnitine CoA-transferase CaiB-like acyl-CoA transferase